MASLKVVSKDALLGTRRSRGCGHLVTPCSNESFSLEDLYCSTWGDTFQAVEIHLIPMDPVALTLKVEQKVALTGLAGLAR